MQQTTSTSTEKKPTLLSWWYQLTAIPEPQGSLSFLQRETIRKSRFLSVIVGSLLVSFIIFIPGCLVLPNHYVIVADVGMMPICLVALVLNKLRRPMIAGILLTAAFEAALTMVVLTSIPFDPPTLQQYELFVFGEVLAVSLISPGWVWGVAAYNIAFIVWSLLFQQYKDPAFIYELQTQFWAILVRPVAVQFVVAFVTFLWVNGALGAIKRADTAELRAKLEAQLREAEAERNEEKRQLEGFIKRITDNHALLMNEGKVSRIPSEEYPSWLWAFINVFNMQQARAQRARETEKQHRWLTQTIEKSTNLANQGLLPLDRPTGTVLDDLLMALRRQGAILRGREAREGNYKLASAVQPTQSQPIQQQRGEFQPFDMPPFDKER